jgi:hypothetical protein
MMQDQLFNGPCRMATDDHRVESSSTQVPGLQSYRDARLHEAYSRWDSHDLCLHLRRTLDQFWYKNIDRRERDADQVFRRNQESDMKDSEKEESATLMVDQLWIWILGPSLVLTSVPQDWQQPRDELPDLLLSVLEEIDPRSGNSVRDVYELAACMGGQCLSYCDDDADQGGKPSVLAAFDSAIDGVASDENTLLLGTMPRV